METFLTLGKLYIVATPIGNLEDMTLRGIRVLKEVDLIAAEDTRHTGKLLKHFEVKTPQISYHEHNSRLRGQELVSKLEQGTNIALVSDAGMPGISDPGAELIASAIAAGILIIPIPGVSASITALVSSGLATERFVFEGFLPTQGKLRKERLQGLQNEVRTIVLYEAPHRLLTSLKDLAKVLGQERSLVLGRELTKIHEEFWRGDLQGAIALYTEKVQPKGEYTLVIAGSQVESNLILSEEQIKAELTQLLEQGMTRSQACRYLAEQTSFSRRQIYQLSVNN
ncbi:putative S-adenosylmethionine-dependent methyltransferase, YraL family [Xenococcus sp. PCC 7305]|uniref:16S rRNA (cytidine(1402)-2'-O)-methyltransferase n=1 Tax=Xenococcus sp. PCC 7305 TaxID=102125 RepID=UPI0002AC52D7|nr:16S rRNA (cytidine(1402)-2'-O)-methyltransferase [Xenococcus sp. PCC 7305]ELS01243.1 putative S-adenosylmethionine-dependent methyltransferase, YraL family [Xenococcus sp. PCC 7305]